MNQRTQFAIVAIFAFVVFVGVALYVMAQPRPVAAAPAAVAPIAVAPPPVAERKEPTLTERLAMLPTLADAIDVVRPIMSDESEKDSLGAIGLAAWASRRMQWADVAVQSDETSFARVQKDPESARGKRLCIPGNVVEIHTDRSGGAPVYVGLMMSGAGNLFRYRNVGSSGDLVGGSWARMCGVVIGTYDYENSGGGVGHAVAVVGMFDLPENKAKPAKK